MKTKTVGSTGGTNRTASVNKPTSTEERLEPAAGDFCVLHFALVRAFKGDRGILLSYLLNLENYFGPGFYRTRTQILNDLGFAQRTLERHLQWLRKAGYLSWAKPGGYDRRRRFALNRENLVQECEDFPQLRPLCHSGTIDCANMATSIVPKRQVHCEEIYKDKEEERDRPPTFSPSGRPSASPAPQRPAKESSSRESAPGAGEPDNGKAPYLEVQRTVRHLLVKPLQPQREAGALAELFRLRPRLDQQLFLRWLPRFLEEDGRLKSLRQLLSPKFEWVLDRFEEECEEEREDLAWEQREEERRAREEAERPQREAQHQQWLRRETAKAKKRGLVPGAIVYVDKDEGPEYYSRITGYESRGDELGCVLADADADPAEEWFDDKIWFPVKCLHVVNQQ